MVATANAGAAALQYTTSSLRCCRYVHTAVADSLRRDRQPGDCSQIEFSLPESQFVAVMHHLLGGKFVADSVIAKARHSYAGNRSVTRLGALFIPTAFSARNIGSFQPSYWRESVHFCSNRAIYGCNRFAGMTSRRCCRRRGLPVIAIRTKSKSCVVVHNLFATIMTGLIPTHLTSKRSVGRCQ